jgi:hypothetical protein
MALSARKQRMQTLQIHDSQPSGFAVVDPRSVLKLLGERALQAFWRVAGVARYDEDVMIVGDEAADRLEALSHSQSLVPGTVLVELVNQTGQVIWGEFRAYLRDETEPWMIVRAIDGSWCEIETQDEQVLELVRQSFTDVRPPA